jgi:hypothetical protein
MRAKGLRVKLALTDDGIVDVRALDVALLEGRSL